MQEGKSGDVQERKDDWFAIFDYGCIQLSSEAIERRSSPKAPCWTGATGVAEGRSQRDSESRHV